MIEFVNPSVRVAALLFSIYVVWLMLLPARWLFALGGAGSLIAGFGFMGTHPESATVGLLIGVGLILLSVRAFRNERRNAQEQARLAAIAANRMARRHRSHSRLT